MRCYLAIDKGKGTLPEDEDRYVLIDISKLGYTKEMKKGNKVINESRNYFSSLEEAINFTKQYEDYADLFIKLYDHNLIDKSLLGKPFTYCYYSEKKANPKKNTWKHYGEKELINYDKIIFNKHAYLFDNPSSKEIESIKKKESNKKLPITHELLALELNIPEYFDLYSDQLDANEKKKFYFIKALVEKFTKMLNEQKKAKVYNPNPVDGILNDYTMHVNYLDGMIKELNSYLYIAEHDHKVISERFYVPINYIINSFCIKNYHDKYVINKTALFDIASFCIAYRERITKRHSTEIAKVKIHIEEQEIKKQFPFFTPTTGEQLTFFDEFYQEQLKRDRKKGND